MNPTGGTHAKPSDCSDLMARRLAAAVFTCGMLLAIHSAAAQADLALVLAVDVSSSVDETRFQLQREGIAEGLLSQSVLEAVVGGPYKTIELAIVEWSEDQTVLVDWTIIRNHADLNAVAQALRSQARPGVGWKTDIGGAITKGVALFDSAPLPADRKIIDVSGDGQQNQGKIAAERARDAAVGKEITINGLPITSGDEPEVDRWYRDHVVGGTGAFVVVANGHDNFADAMRMKLAFEIVGLSPTLSLAALH
jgi:Protein of unknown function (DUF1194)